MRNTVRSFIGIFLFLILSLIVTACQSDTDSRQNEHSQEISESSQTTAVPTQTVETDVVSPSPEPTPTLPPIQLNKPEPWPKPDRSAAKIYEANPKLTPVNYQSKALLPPSADRGQNYLNRITFICDSPTYWMWPYGLLNNGKDSKQIWTGPEGTMTLAYQGSYEIYDPFDRVERPIRDVVALHKPDILVIALGINGVSFMDEDYFTKEYTDLVTDIQSISPKTILLLQSIYPITHRYKHYGSITNAMITEANSWILRIAEQTGCHYLDTISVLLNEEGNAKDELMMKDGLHPNKEGLNIILDYIRHHGYRAKPSRQLRERFIFQ